MKIIRGNTKRNNFSRKEFDSLLDFSFLIWESKIETNVAPLSKETFSKLLDYSNENDIEINLYYESWDDLLSVVDKTNTFENNVQEINEFKAPIYEILTSLSKLTHLEKFNLALDLVYSTKGIIRIDQAFNKNIILIDNLLKRMLVDNE